MYVLLCISICSEPILKLVQFFMRGINDLQLKTFRIGQRFDFLCLLIHALILEKILRSPSDLNTVMKWYSRLINKNCLDVYYYP